MRVIHTELNQQYAKDIAECQTARVAHEYLLVLFLFSPDVMIKKRNQYTHQACNKDAVDPYLFTLEDKEKTR